jgi:hypothetical protein
MAFSQRIINLRFQLGDGNFGDGSANTVDLTGLRCSVNITKAGSLGNQDCEVRIWGMPLEMMNKLTILNKLAFGQQLNNVLTVFAGDDQHAPGPIFAGTIMEAWADGRDPPDMMFHVSATAGLVDMIKPGDPISFKGDVDAATALGQMAKAMGLSLENSGVTGSLHNPYWPGSIGMQLRAMCEALDCNFVTDYVDQVLAVWPIDGARQSDAVAISPQTGLRGYPSFTQDGLQIVSLFNPLIAYGRRIEVKSQFTAANGSKWVAASVSHNLDSNVPDGEWFTQVECGLFGYAIPLIN